MPSSPFDDHPPEPRPGKKSLPRRLEDQRADEQVVDPTTDGTYDRIAQRAWANRNKPKKAEKR